MGIEIIYFGLGIGCAVILFFLRSVTEACPEIKENSDEVLYRHGKSEKYYSEGFAGQVQRVASKFKAATSTVNSNNTSNSYNTYNTSFGDVKIYILPALEYNKGNEFLCSSGQEPAEYIDYEKMKSIQFEETMPVIRPLQKQFDRIIK